MRQGVIAGELRKHEFGQLFCFSHKQMQKFDYQEWALNYLEPMPKFSLKS